MCVSIDTLLSQAAAATVTERVVTNDVTDIGLADSHDKKTKITREHCIQRITFAAENNALCSRGSADTHAHCVTPSDTIPFPFAKRRRR